MSTLAAHRPGKSFPLGATLVSGGANFSVFSKHSTGAQLLLFDDGDASKPSRVIDLDPRTNRTYPSTLNTTRRTERETVTERTIISVGTAAPKVPLPTPRSRGCAIGKSRTF